MALRVCLHMVHFMPFYQRMTTFVTSCLLLEKRCTLEGKNLLHRSKFLYFREDPNFTNDPRSSLAEFSLL